MTLAPLSNLMILLHVALQSVFIVRALLRRHREPSSRLAWVLVILVLPAAGMIAYLLFGETNIGRRRVTRYRETAARLSELSAADQNNGALDLADPDYRHLFKAGRSISGFSPVAGNSCRIMPDQNATIASMVADIDAATRNVHLLFFIWLADKNGLKVIEAAKRAAGRGVQVRILVDDIGSRRLIRSYHWTDMASAGVHVARALPVGNIFLHPIRGRVDLRNHRKIAVIDEKISYCGSQNCADPEFRVKAKYAPWVDLTVRIEGPVVWQNSMLFLEDWLAHTDENLSDLAAPAPEDTKPDGVLAQVIGTGPTVRPSAMPEMFEALIHAARHELVITTPYYVPTEAMHAALCAAGYRGVRTSLVLPARNDSWVVAAASRSYYPDLVEAGVRVFEFPSGLLHAKSLTLDGKVALIGSANLDRRSFELNYENNVLVQDRTLVHGLKTRQDEYVAASNEIRSEQIARWGPVRRVFSNSIAMLAPVL